MKKLISRLFCFSFNVSSFHLSTAHKMMKELTLLRCPSPYSLSSGLIPFTATSIITNVDSLGDKLHHNFFTEIWKLASN